MLPTSVAVTFAARPAIQPGQREIAGRLLPWGHAAYSRGRTWRFAKHSVHWPADVSRVKLNRDHDPARAVGVALAFESRDDGLYGTFRIARTAEGDELLASAQDGVADAFSVEVAFGDDDEVSPDLNDPTVMLVTRGSLTGVASTASPAYEEARVQTVAASRDTTGGTVRLPDLWADPQLAEQVRATQQREGVSFADLARRGLAVVTREAPVYRFDGTGPSLVADAWSSFTRSGTDPYAASDRLRRFRGQLDDGGQTAFTVTTTGNASQVIPPGYRTDPNLSVLVADRPLDAAATALPLTDGAPFSLPPAATATGATAVHVEGVAPTEATLTLGANPVVNPTGISGFFRVSREIADSSNPAIDMLAMAIMSESYAEQTEQRVYSELNGTNGQAGTISSGRVPSGAQVRSVATATVVAEIRKALSLYPNVRRTRARSVVCSSAAVVTDLLAAGFDERTGDDTAQWRSQAAAINVTPVVAPGSASDASVVILGPQALYVWESAPRLLTYEQRNGPAHVDLCLFAYHAVRLLRPAGLAAIRLT